MSLTQEIDEESENFGSKIILTHKTFEDGSDFPNSSTSDTQNIFLRVGKPGKLYLQPNYTAFTKTSLGSIPSKVEKTLLKTEKNIPITLTLNKNYPNDNTSNYQAYKDPKIYSTSYSSKGYGVGFASSVPRFSDTREILFPGPGQYYPDKLVSMENNVNKSIFGKSMFMDKTNKSLQLLDVNEDKFFTSQELLKKLKEKFKNERYSKSLTNNSFSKNDMNEDNKNIRDNKDKKGNYFFESKVNRGAFNVNNSNPGPGRYFIDNKYVIKNKNKESPDFIKPIERKESPIQTFGLNKNDKKKIGFNLLENKKNGKIFNFWNGAPSFGSSYDFGKTIKNKKKLEKSPDNTVKNFPDYDVSKTLKRLGIMRYKSKDFANEKKYEYKFDKNKRNELMMKDLMKFKKKDVFSLVPPRWDTGLFHDNASHFQIPGPAYYQPKGQTLKKSFNLNKKDFIFTNSVPFKEQNLAM